MLIHLLITAWADCPQATINADLHETLGAATNAYVALDATTFNAQLEKLEQQTICLEEVIAPSYAAAIHRTRGMGAFLAKDFGVAELHFAASRRLEPGYRLPADIAPEGNPIISRFEKIELGAKTERIGAPKAGAYRVDGRTDLERDVRLPLVLQRVKPKGRIVSTEFLEPDAPSPSGEAFRERPPLLLIAGAVFLAGSIGTYAAAAATKNNVSKPGLDKEAIERHFETNRWLVLSSGTLGGLGVGLTVGHVLGK